VFVTHDQEEAMSMSNRIAIMLEGHVEQLGDPETVYERPVSAFVAGFIGRNNFWRGTATADGMVGEDGTVFVCDRPEERVGAGERALSAVRPESFELSATDPGETVNVFPGEVAGVSHFGDTLQFVVRSHVRDVIVLLPRQKAPSLHPGDPVWCQWSARDVYQFSAAQESLVLAEPSSEVAV
jgi:spermidine/putrescine transport system ATP-binding protein